MPDNVLKVATYNVNSVRARLALVLEWLRREAPDILCLQETKVQDKDFPEKPFREAGYHVVFRGRKAHAGVAIVSQEKPLEVAFGLDDGGPWAGSGEGESDEARLIRAVIRGIPVVNTYVPQGRSLDSLHFRYKLEWLARLRTLFEQHYSPQEPLLWMGDFNVAPKPMDVHNPKRLKKHVDFHPEARAALERVREWGFVDVFRLHHPNETGQYTFWDYRAREALERGLGWRVDHIWTTEPLARKATRSWIDVEARQAERPSDHTFLVAEFVT